MALAMVGQDMPARIRARTRGAGRKKSRGQNQNHDGRNGQEHIGQTHEKLVQETAEPGGDQPHGHAED